MTRTHLITGIGGQDGVLLARLLRRAGDRVVGTVVPGSPRTMEPYLGGIEVVEHDVRDVAGFAELVRAVRPEAVHNLAALSSVAASWEDPETTDEVNHVAVRGMLDLLVALPEGDRPAFVQASSSEIFGAVDGRDLVDERTGPAPASPYAESKTRAHEAVTAARDRGLVATNLILFGHTSPLHAPHFALPRLTRQAAEAGLGRRTHLELMNPLVRRDWGSAADFVRAFALALDAPPGDFVVATGEIHQLAEIGRWALEAAGAPDGDVAASGEAARRHDFDGLRGDPTRAGAVLGWRPTTALRSEIERMVRADLLRLTTGVEHTAGYLDEDLTASSEPLPRARPTSQEAP